MSDRKSEIKSAYKSLGKAHSFYDGMMTCSTFMGRLVTKLVWNMDREDALEYQARAFEMIPADFSGKLLEVPVGTGVLSMPVWKTFPDLRECTARSMFQMWRVLRYFSAENNNWESMKNAI